MSCSSVSASIDNFPERHADLSGIRLHDCQGRRGRLTDIIESDREDFLLVRIAGELVELPKTLSEQLRGLIGQRVVVGHVAGQYRVGRCSQ
jgi:hypothetical protein